MEITKRKIQFVTILCWLSVSSSAWPWGKDGHIIVGRIAELRLTTNALAGVNALINSSNTNGTIRLCDDAIVNWADHVRKTWTNSAPWHYVDIPYDAAKYDPVRDCTNHNGCVVDSIGIDFRAITNKQTTAKQRLTALKLLVHFVGDTHQPLHCAFRPYGEHADDRGGNLCPIAFLTPAATNNLHVAWDTLLVKNLLTDSPATNVLQFAEQLNAEITPAEADNWKIGTPEDWANESHALAVRDAYANIPTSGPAFLLDEEYVRKNKVVVVRQLKRAGIRLARLLNEAFK